MSDRIKIPTPCFKFLVRIDGEVDEIASNIISISPRWDKDEGCSLVLVIRDTIDGSVEDALTALQDGNAFELTIEQLSGDNVIRFDRYEDIAMVSRSKIYDYSKTTALDHLVTLSAGSYELCYPKD